MSLKEQISNISKMRRKTRKINKGFTLMEIVLSLGLMILIFALTVPVGFNVYKYQMFNEDVANLTSALRQAQFQALIQKNNSDYGVKILSDSYILFRGGSYNDRIQEDDETFKINSDAIMGGADEIVFAKRLGTTSNVGSITMDMGDRNVIITINSQGAINR